MPLTPLHLGPLLPLKLVAPFNFSLGTFTVVQVVIDLEVVYNIMTKAPVLHDRAHTLAGALLVGLLCLVPAKIGLTAAYRWLRPRLAAREDVPRSVVSALQDVTWLGAITGALIGAITHVALDGLMHMDVHPFAPWSQDNPLWIPDSFVRIHLACALIGLAGLAVNGIEARVDRGR